MKAPRRWIDDPEADATLREVLRGTPGARPLDQVTRRRLGAKVARVSAAPMALAGWVFVKSAAAALGVVLGTGAVAVATGVVDWSPSPTAEHAPEAPKKVLKAAAAPARPAVSAASVAEPTVELEEQKVNPVPSLPAAPASAPSVGTLSAEAALLEQARREMRGTPREALSLAAEHARRFPRGQLAAERTLIQIEALHRLNRDEEARSLARGLLGGAGAGLYAERVHQLLGESVAP